MTFRAETLDISISGGRRRALDFFELTKPRLVLMVLITTCVGFYLGAGEVPNYLQLIHTLIGTALAAGGTLALNQLIERETDARMERTRHRPLPEGRVQPIEVLIFGLLSTAAGLVILALAVNVFSSLITAIIVVIYLFFYTPLKQKTSLCSVVGAIPGALPPLIGWVAAHGSLGLEAWILFALLFLWQIPHSLAIARLYRVDFARAGFRFLPVVEPDGGSTGRQIVGHSLALLVVSLMPTLLGLAGLFYYVTALLLGGAFLVCGAIVAIDKSVTSARRLLFASLLYLPLVLLVMALDRGPIPL
ncbi:MAG: heme o synthase [Candidatus Binatia bacterium]